ncbi:MAG: hypothetical protein M9894_19580 [Planctomycetes bacterium]|nr:hypothetical protein [Planctomycetota bacterium]
MLPTAANLRLLALRAAIFVSVAWGVLLALGALDAPGMALTGLAVALITPSWQLELRAAGAPPGAEPNAPFLVWIVAAAAALFWGVQAPYLLAVLRTGSIGAGLDDGWHMVEQLAGAPAQTALAAFAAGCPFALACHVRLRGWEPRATVFLGAYALLLGSTCLMFLTLPALVVTTFVLVRLYGLADALARLLRRSGAHDGVWPLGLPTHATLWRLGYLGHAPAREALGWRDEPSRDLQAFVRGLEPAGRLVCAQAAAAAARLALPYLEERRTGDAAPRHLVEALEAWSREGTPATREAALAALSACPAPEEAPAARVLHEAAQALEGEPPWATVTAAVAAARAAGLVAELMDGPAPTREALRVMLLERTLEEALPANRDQAR